MKYFLLIVLVLFFRLGFSQVLVRVGNENITRSEFLTAFHKNNTNKQVGEKAYRDYLDLYIRYRLKVKAALDLRMDTLPGQITELQNFKAQIVDQYINDEVSLNLMVKEAFKRSQQDLQLAYIFVAVAKNASPSDTAKAWKKIQEAAQALQQKKDFADVAVQYSDDPFVKSNKGDLHWITVFDLPYGMENIAYSTSGGMFSPVTRIESGYVIIKKIAERPAVGRIHIEQILVAFPYEANANAKAETKRRADSIYKAVTNGAVFAEMARKFSGDNLSYQLGGALPEFGIGKYEWGFENTAYGLKKDGEISRPYESAFGYHIIKRIKRIPIRAVADTKINDELKEKIKADPRIAISKQLLLKAILQQMKFRENIPAGDALWDYTDSVMQNKKSAANSPISSEAVLFSFPEKNYRVSDWLAYRTRLKSMSSLTNGKSPVEIFDMYRQNVAFEYYKLHLEKYNAAYAEQVSEFRNGNLLFEIMQEKIWTKASADSAGLQKYFLQHEKQYWWKPGAEAIIFTASTAAVAARLKTELSKNIKQWRVLVAGLSGLVQADSGRFESKQIPAFMISGTAKAGTFTAQKANTDKSIQFAYIIREYRVASARNFDDARGLVINDYQTELENKWIAELEKQYPVVIDEAVFKTLRN